MSTRAGSRDDISYRVPARQETGPPEWFVFGEVEWDGARVRVGEANFSK